MAITIEEKVRTIIDSMTDDGAVSILTQTYIEYNGEEQILQNHREALVPTQIDRAKEILPDNQYKALKELWTPAVVNAWVKKQEAIEAEFNAHMGITE